MDTNTQPVVPETIPEQSALEQEIPQIVSNQSPPPIINESSEPKSKLVPILLIILIISVLVVGGFFVYKTYFSQNTIQPIGNSTSQPVSTPDPTADWQTYTNEKYGYSFKYPSDWKVEAENGEDPTTTFSPSFSSPCNFNNDGRCTNLTLALGGKYKEGQNLEYYFNINIQDIVSKRDIVVGGEKALEIKYHLAKEYVGHEGEPAIEIKAIHNKNVLTIQYGEQQSTSLSELKYENIFDQILSTFKFTDQASINYTCPTSGYVDCMPTVGETKTECSTEAMSWYKANCPNFKGGAY
jgi:hypothetical protein